jgi:diguanylate cyclase (GGDEF)-like protein/PAS domain S-box-containing protein
MAVAPSPLTLEDPSAAARALALAEILRQATQASLDPAAVLEILARWSARTVGDLAVVRIPSHDGVPATGAAAHADPHVEPGADEALRGDDDDTPPSGGHRMRATLRSRGRDLGTLTLTRAAGRPPFRGAERELVEEVAHRIGLVYDNARLYERVRLHAATLEHVDAAVCAVDAEGAITAFNPAAQRMFGWSETEALGRSPVELVSAEPPERIAAVRRSVLEQGGYAGACLLRRRDGETFDGHVDIVVVYDDRGGVTGMVAVLQDLSERLRLIAQLERRAAQQAAVAALGERALEAEDPAWLLDLAVAAVRGTLNVELAAVLELADDGRRLAVRAGAGFAGDAAHGASLPAGWADSQEGFTLIHREPVIVDDAAAERRFAQGPLVAEHGAVSGVTVLVQGRGGPHAVLAAHSTRAAAFVADDVTFLQSMANVLGDALDRFLHEEEIRHRGLHDPLTGLPNRALLIDRLGQAAQRLDRTKGHVALMFLDLDHFKNVNDSLGHRAGDEVLREVAGRLRAAVRPADTVGRLGGDEFVVLCEDVDDEGMAMAIADRLTQAFAAPFRAGGDEHVLGASIGIALLDADGDAEALLRDADAAMYRAKEHGRARVELFDTGMRAWAAGRLQTEAALRRALDGTEFELRYQPIVDLADGSIAAVEALVRWRHPEKGLLAPEAFVGVAEDSGLIVPLGRRVLELATAQAAAWAALRHGRPPVPVHVNLSPRQLHDQGLVDAVRDTLTATGAPAGALALEITESMLIDRGPDRLALLEELRELGVELLLDDFGTGWSSLSHLAQLPITGLKIDRSFVAGLDGSHAPIVDAIVRLARAFALPVVAEGIEDEGQLDALRRLGCDLGQGFLFACPMTAAELTPLVISAEPPFGRADRAA